MKTLLLFFLCIGSAISGLAQRQLLGQTQRNYYPGGDVFQDSLKYVYAGQEGSFNSLVPKNIISGVGLTFDIGYQNNLIVHCLSQIKRSGFTYSTPFQTVDNNILDNGLVIQTNNNATSRYLYEYDANGNRLSSTHETYSSANGWAILSKIEYSYEANGSLHSRTSFNYTPQIYVHSSDTIWYMIGTDKMISSIRHTNDLPSYTPIPVYKSEASFNADNIEFIDNFSMTSQGTWDWTHRNVYLYNAENLCVDLKKYAVVDSVLDLAHFSQEAFLYTPTNNISERIRYDALGEIVEKEFFNYDAFEFIKNRQIYEFDSSGDSTLVENQNFYFDGFLDVKENELESISIYPNPTTGSVKLQLDFELINVTLYNELGQLLLEQKNSEIDLSHLNSGVYIIKGETKNGSFQKKVIKK